MYVYMYIHTHKVSLLDLICFHARRTNSLLASFVVASMERSPPSVITWLCLSAPPQFHVFGSNHLPH